MHKSKRIAKASYLIQIKLLRQFGDVHRDPPRFVARRQLGRRSPAGFILETDVNGRLAVAISDSETRSLLLD